MLEHGFLYPHTGLYACQHSLFPRALMSNHPFVPRPKKTIDGLISLLKNEIVTSSAHTCILSSEVFTEISDGREELLYKLFDAFDESAIFLTTRDRSQQALSAMKHMLRDSQSNIDRYQDMARNCISNFNSIEKYNDTISDYWLSASKNHGVDFQAASLEGGGRQVIKHYLANFPVSSKSEAWQRFLTELKPEDEIKNNDGGMQYSSLEYLVLFLSGILCKGTSEHSSLYLETARQHLKAYPDEDIHEIGKEVDSKLIITFFHLVNVQPLAPIDNLRLHSLLSKCGMKDANCKILVSIATGLSGQQPL